jgi:uncharacterized protein YdiU (UPF0061 family)
MSLDILHFDNSFLRELPTDPENTNARRQVHGACHSRVQPTPVKNPSLVAYSEDMAGLLGISREACLAPQFAEVMGGNSLAQGMDPWAACYGGHQFGNWAGQLGDGRAISLGEAVTPSGDRWELQLKGAGPTPYSRRGDGRAVMRSSIREFLCSEAMHHLGVPTTRALSLVSTGDEVVRDMFYDGHARAEPGAIVCRMAPTFLRFGNYQILAARQDHELLRSLVDYTVAIHHPHLVESGEAATALWFTDVCERTAVMIVHWMRVGFVHGVMNTDNMSILGQTIDYGPYGWLDNYDPNWTPNTTDAHGGRYRYGHQPKMAFWNLLQLANALHPIVGEAKPLEDALARYAVVLEEEQRKMVANKLGLRSFTGRGSEGDSPPTGDAALFEDLQNLLMAHETDMTLFFRNLADVPLDPTAPENSLLAPVEEAFYAPDTRSDAHREGVSAWIHRWIVRAASDGREAEERREQMNAANPRYVLRNYLAQMAIEAWEENGDAAPIHRLQKVLQRPYEDQSGCDDLAEKRPEWARDKPGCSTLSCSS